MLTVTVPSPLPIPVATVVAAKDGMDVVLTNVGGSSEGIHRHLVTLCGTRSDGNLDVHSCMSTRDW